jgi:hypothetical protein
MDSSTISTSQHDYSFHLRTKCNRKLKAYNILEPPTRGRDLLASSISKSNKSKEGNHLIELMMGKTSNDQFYAYRIMHLRSSIISWIKRASHTPVGVAAPRAS